MNDEEYYTYTLAKPDGTVFYVGEGKGNRLHAHELEAVKGIQSPKCDVIRQVHADGGCIIATKVHEHLSLREAIKRDAELVKFHGFENLTNKTPTGRAGAPKENRNAAGKRVERERIPVMFSLSGELLDLFAEYLSSQDIEPTDDAVKKVVRDWTYPYWEERLKREIMLSGQDIAS